MLSILDRVKLSRRIVTDDFDDELTEIIESGKMDLGIAGVSGAEEDPLIRQALVTYTLCHFGNPEDYERLKASFDEQKAQLAVATGYTQWTE